MSSRAEGFQRILKALGPTAVGLVSVLILVAPLRLFAGLAPTPILPLIVVFFWTIAAPAYMPSFSVFLIGLLQDFLSGGPLGLWPAVYLAIQYMVLAQRSYFAGREMRVVWVGFAFAALCAALMVWLVMSIMSQSVLSFRDIIWLMTVTALVYPVFSIAFARMHRAVFADR